MSYLSWENLVVGYSRQKPLIYPCSGLISEPGIYAILGQNGSGKSTLLKTWLGLLKPLAGKVTINDSPVPTKHDVSQGLTYIPQFHSVNRYFHITTADFVKQGYGPNYKENEKDAITLKELFVEWQLAEDENRSFHELSGGQKTRAMIIRSIIAKPKILFLDEPLASLDNCCQEQLMSTLSNLAHEKKVCIFMIDHHFEKFGSFIAKKIVFTRKHDDEKASVEVV